MVQRKKKNYGRPGPQRTNNKNAVNKPKYSGANFVNNPQEQKAIDQELNQIDLKLTTQKLIRLQVPKDGACLFRCVAEQIYGTQELHPRTRELCVEYLQKNAKEFQDFVSGSYEEYVEEMKHLKCWGGQIELQALSKIYNVNFTIYSILKEPTEVHNGYDTSVQLCFSHGNHYDNVYPVSRFNAISISQEIVMDLIEEVLEFKIPSQTGSTKNLVPFQFQNIGWINWIDQLKEQEKQDREIALKTSKELEKEPEPKKTDPSQDSFQKPRNPRINNKMKYQVKRLQGAKGNENFVDEEKARQEAIRAVEEFEKKEREKLKRSDPLHYPPLSKNSISNVQKSDSIHFGFIDWESITNDIVVLKQNDCWSATKLLLPKLVNKRRYISNFDSSELTNLDLIRFGYFSDGEWTKELTKVTPSN
eukprot:TRINITY_DN7600_c0_g2_i1.p1 TRINITY_DN7600_c0_g2~~TRINITY_DN7600_c0_g2_i1.p1  ORF type:complete len:418 (+),score=91.48 TRINITY_DN7600_c0_g2_i1:114-1367(+)